jgi:hypothetical protein
MELYKMQELNMMEVEEVSGGWFIFIGISIPF